MRDKCGTVISDNNSANMTICSKNLENGIISEAKMCKCF